MTKYSCSDPCAFPEANEYDLEDTESDNSWLPTESLAYPGAQYFNAIMCEKMRPKKVAKFKVSRKLASDL